MNSVPSNENSNSQKARILVADDDPHMQQAIKACLSRDSYNLTIVGHGLAAIEQLEQDSFDLVITDQQMPNMSGIELIATMQKRQIDIPVVMITAYGTINQAVEAMQLGAAATSNNIEFNCKCLERIVLDRIRRSEHANDIHGANLRSPVPGAEHAKAIHLEVNNKPKPAARC
jgi:DNA-binding NtrC family response regulator